MAGRQGVPRRGIRLDLDLVALGDRRARVDEVRDEERPALGARAHRDVGAEVQRPSPSVAATTASRTGNSPAAERITPASAGWSGHAASTGWKLVVSVMTASAAVAGRGDVQHARASRVRAPSG